MKNLTESEKFLVLSILKMIGRDDEMNALFAQNLGMGEEEFNEVADSVVEKLSEK